MDNKQKKETNENKRNRHFRHHRRRGHKKPSAQVEKTAEVMEVNAPAVLPEKSYTETIPAEDATPVPEIAKEQIESPALETEKVEVVGIRFRPVGKNYSFDPDGHVFKMGEYVIVETSQGKEFGTVSTPNRFISINEAVLPLKKVVRPATDKDIARNEENREMEKSARKTFLEKVSEHELDMALSDVEYSFDRSKLVFYFTSEGRVDFREFVKDLAGIFKTRIELRQIGVRDEAKQLGGLGICGRPLCCSSFLDDFQQVSIKMAKEQNLSLNPTKISGTCGRLMCCLRYENDVYVEAAKKCPKIDCTVMTPQGRGVVVDANILCGKCKVKLDSDPDNLLPFTADELKVLPKQKKSPAPGKEKKEADVPSDENQ